jgi:hypothetical protein
MANIILSLSQSLYGISFTGTNQEKYGKIWKKK